MRLLLVVDDIPQVLRVSVRHASPRGALYVIAGERHVQGLVRLVRLRVHRRLVLVPVRGGVVVVVRWNAGFGRGLGLTAATTVRRS